MNEKIKELCAKAADGTVSCDEFYDRLCAAAQDTRTDDDTVCILEDAIMELEMLHDEGASKKELKEAAAENARCILEELDRLYCSPKNLSVNS